MHRSGLAGNDARRFHNLRTLVCVLKYARKRDVLHETGQPILEDKVLTAGRIILIPAANARFTEEDSS